MIDNNRNNNKKSGRAGNAISSLLSLLSLRFLLVRWVALALLAGIGTSCSQSMDEEAMTRIGAPMTVTATMQGVGKPAAAVSEVVPGSDTGLPATRTTTTDEATAGVYTAAWQKNDVVSVTFHCYSDAAGTEEIAASQMLNGNTQTLSYDGTAWTASPSSLRLPVDVYSVKVVYTYSRAYTAADDTPIDATTTRVLMHRGTEQIAGQSTVVIPDDITKTGIAIAPAADKWQRQTALVRFTSLAFGQSATVTTASGAATIVSCPTVQTADPTQPANGVLTSTVYLYLPVDDPANTAAVTTVTANGVNGVVKPVFHTEAGRLYSIYAPVLLGQQGVGDEDGGQVWNGTYANFYNGGRTNLNLHLTNKWIIDFSTVTDAGELGTDLNYVKNVFNVSPTVNLTLTGIEKLPDNVFQSSIGLGILNLPTVKEIGNYSVFSSNLTSVSMPEVTIVGANAFAACTKLVNLNMPKIKTISYGAFQNCKVLTNLSLPALATLNAYAFAGCISLVSIDFPVATEIGNSAFNSCTSLVRINLPVANSIGELGFSRCSLTDLTLPAATYIGPSAFWGCTSLTSLNLPMTNKIGNYFLSGCSALTALKLTTSEPITYDNYSFSDFANSANCTLYLNANKKYGGSSTPTVGTDGLTWLGQKWKAIQYVD